MAPTAEQWIDIPNWDSFYEKRREVKAGKRRMTWVKLYFDLLTDDDWIELTPPMRSLLVGIWMLFGSTAGKVPKSTRYLSRVLQQHVTIQQLERLNHAGFITFTGTRPEPAWFQNVSLEGEGEGEGEGKGAAGSPNGAGPPPQQPELEPPIDPNAATRLRDLAAKVETGYNPDE